MNFYKFLTLILVFAFCSSNSIAKKQSKEVNGTVFLDSNENGILDGNEKGLENILISNQKEVVKTDGNGKYTITLTPGQALMIVKPSGYDIPVNEFQIPQNSFVYEPNGSPKLKFGGLKPTTSFPSEVNFPLAVASGEEKFNAIIFGDPQPRDDKELTYVRDEFLNQATTEDARFMMILGDIMYNDLSLFDRHIELFSKPEIPVWHVIGNHDIDFDTKDNRHARDTFKRHFGANYYAYQYGKVTYLALDNVNYLGRNNEGRSRYEGGIWGDQLTWLENLLPNIPEDHLIVIATHIPLYAWGGETPNVNTKNREDLFKLLEQREKVIAVSGHLHMTYHHYLTEEQGWNGKNPMHHLTTTAVSGTWWGGPADENGIPTTTQRDGVPNGYHRFTFTGSDYSEQLVGLGERADLQIRIESPALNFSTDEMPERLVVNVLNGNEKNKTWYRINNGAWVEMEQISESSPYFKTLLDRHSENWSNSTRAIPTNHLWTAPFPKLDRIEKTFTIEIRTVDAYSKEWRNTKIFEID